MLKNTEGEKIELNDSFSDGSFNRDGSVWSGQPWLYERYY